MGKNCSLAFTLVAMLFIGVASSRAQVATTQPAKKMIAGRVLDTDGKPLGGAIVIADVRDSTGNQINRPTTRSADDGRFAVEFSSNGPYPSMVFAFVPGKGFSKSVPVTDSPVELKLSPITELRLTFLDMQDRPLAGVSVEPLGIVFRAGGGPVGFSYDDLPEDDRKLYAATTDATGQCALTGLPRFAQVNLDLADDRYATLNSDARQVQLSGEAQTNHPAIHVHQAGTIVGRLLNPDTGKPIPDMKLAAEAFDVSVMSYGDANTDADGRFTIKRLSPGTYKVQLGYPYPAEWTAKSVSVDVLEGQPSTAEVALTHGGMVVGTIRDATTDAPIVGVNVDVTGPAVGGDRNRAQRANTDASGKFSLRVPAGKQSVNVPFAPDGYALPKPATIEVTVEDGKNTAANFVCEAVAVPTLSGTVIDPDGNPVSGAQVLYESPSPDMSQFGKGATSDAQGHFTLRGAVAHAQLRARYKDLATASPVRVNSISDDLEIKLSATASYDLAVHVTDANGNPVPSAELELTTMGLFFGEGSTGHPVNVKGDASFEKLFRDTKYFVDADADGFGHTSATVTNPKSGANQQTITLKLKNATSQIAGTVCDESGNPLANISVTLNGGGAGFKTTKTDATGHFSFSVADDVHQALVELGITPGTRPTIVHADSGQTDLQLAVHPAK